MSNFSNNSLYVGCKPYMIPKVEDRGQLTAGTRNNKGRYTAGRIIVRTAQISPASDEGTFFSSVESYSTVLDYASDSPIAILAIPKKFTYGGYSANNYTKEFVKNKYNVYEPFIYWVCFANRRTNCTVLDNRYNHGYNGYNYRVAGELQNSYNDDWSQGGNTAPIRITALQQDLKNSYDRSYEYPYIDATVLNEFTAGIIRNESLNNIYVSYISSGSNISTIENNMVSSTQLLSSLPVFLYNNLDEMAKYFDSGEWISDNEEELIVSELDLKTDWTIYVNGAQNPNISTTWKSEALETFLDSDSNKTGLKKENVQVEFRYPLYEHTGFGLGLKASEYSQDTLVFDGGYNYNSKKNDSYESLMFQNYPYLKERFEVDSFIYGENSEPRIETEKDFYSQLQFRLKINNEKFSSWCYFKIGVIGSPNIADFSEMQNEGNVLGSVISDGSTVTIVYDESPAGEEGDKGYIDPTPDTPDIDPSEPTPIVNPTESGLNLLTTSYVMTEEQIKQLANFLWGATFLQNLQLVNNSPIENIVGCKMIPIAISGSNSVVQIGNVDTNVNGAVVSSVPVVTIGSLSIGKLYDNFLDYAPYTQITLFLPFIGFVEIDTNVVVDNTLSVKYVFDIVTGTCKAMLYVNGIYYTSYNGSCGIDIPLVASNRAQVESQFLSSVINGAISGNVGGIVGAGIGAQYHSQSSGSYSPTCGWQETKQVYAIINRPTCQYPETYGHNIGYPCKLSRSLNSLSGFTVCDSNVDLSGIACTEMERQEIYNALTSGVYL